MSHALAQGRAGDTIFALASGPGRAAIAVLRVSGDCTRMYVERLCGTVPPARRASVRRLKDDSGAVLDEALVLWMPGPGSFTGEDSAEFHVHGGTAVREAVSAALLSLGARPADPGEFSRRAFLAGRMGLLEAEAVADLVEAETEAQRVQALRQFSGTQTGLVAALAARLKQCLAFQEALIDFPDEASPAESGSALWDGLQGLLDDFRAHIASSARGERLREGLVFAIVGAPNVGKSSLLNALARRDVAIVSPLPGTTRDALDVPVDLGGVKVTLVDTAGLRETDDAVEGEGVRRARARAESADLILCVVESTAPEPVVGSGLVVVTKVDLAAAPEGWLGVSALTGEGMAALEARLAEEAARLTCSGADPVFTRARHRAALRDAVSFIEAALDCDLPELRAEELRLAVQALGRITGAVDAESILDDVFSAFCIGK